MRRADESTEDQTPGPENSPQPEVSHTDVAQRADGAKPPPVDDEGSAAGPGPKQGPSPGFPPVAVFLVMLGTVIAIIAIVLATRDERDSELTLPRETPLSDTDAVTELENLVARSNLAFRERDLSQLSSIYTSSSPVLSIATDEINQMLDDKVINRSVYESIEITLVTSSPEQLVLRERTRIAPQFESEEGKDVTRDNRKIIQTVRWTLRKENGVWQIHDSVIEASELVGTRE